MGVTLIKGPYSLAAKEAAVQDEIHANYVSYFAQAMQTRVWVANYLPPLSEMGDWPQVSRQTATMLLGFLGVEAHEPDYVYAAINGAGDSMATRETYWEWGNEERRHIQALRNCIIAAGLFTQRKVDSFLHETTRERWTFEDQTGLPSEPLAGALYAVAQERHTRKVYTALRRHVWREYGSPYLDGHPIYPAIAGVLRYPEIDEGAHEKNFRIISLIYLKYFPDRVIDLMLKIYGSRYRMPILHQPHSDEFIKAVLATGVDSPREYKSEVRQPSIERMGFEDSRALRRAAEGFWDLPEGAVLQLPGKPITELSVGSASSIYEMRSDGSFSVVEAPV